MPTQTSVITRMIQPAAMPPITPVLIDFPPLVEPVHQEKMFSFVEKEFQLSTHEEWIDTREAVWKC